MAEANFRVGGLASGLDTNSIIDKLVQLESRPLDQLKARQTATKAQVSALGAIASKLSALETAATALGTSGALGLRVGSNHTAFSATPGTGASAGAWSLEVSELASAAKWRSAGAAAGATFAAGTLDFTVQGKPYRAAIAAGATLADVAGAIRQSGAPVNVGILTTGTQSYLSVIAKDAGYPVAGAPADALSFVTTPGSVGAALGLAQQQQATNSAFTVDGLSFVRTSNVVSDALPGVTLTLQAKGGAAEQLSLDTDVDATKAKLQAFADAYNGVLSLVQKNLDVSDRTDRASTLAGDSTLRFLQSRLQSTISAQVSGLGTVRTLADLGFTSARDGSLSIDSTVLAAAVARDPGAVDALFSTATTGIRDVTSSLVQGYVKPVDGLLSARGDGLTRTLRSMVDDQARWEQRIAAYRDGLVRQFTAMENVVSKLKNLGTYLNNTASQSSSK